MQDRNSVAETTAMICPCFEFTRDDMIAEIAADPSIGFEDLLAKTNVGSKCTACLLDAEYAFSVLYDEARRNGGAVASARSGARKKKGEEVAFRQKVYRAVDSVAPRVALRLVSLMPVFFGREVDSYAVMTNNSLLYKGEFCAPDYRFAVTVRDADGTVVMRDTHMVRREDFCRIRLSAELRARHPAIEFGVGSVEIVQIAASDGVRGTRRPQLEVVTPRAASSLHGQAPYKRAASNSFVAPNRPNDEQPYISVVSNSETPLTMTLTLPLERTGSTEGGPATVDHVIPPHGATLIPLSLAGTSAEAYDAPIMTVGWTASGPQKVHLVTSTRNHDRIALDHL